MADLRTRFFRRTGVAARRAGSGADELSPEVVGLRRPMENYAWSDGAD